MDVVVVVDVVVATIVVAVVVVETKAVEVRDTDLIQKMRTDAQSMVDIFGVNVSSILMAIVIVPEYSTQVGTMTQRPDADAVI